MTEALEVILVMFQVDDQTSTTGTAGSAKLADELRAIAERLQAAVSGAPGQTQDAQPRDSQPRDSQPQDSQPQDAQTGELEAAIANLKARAREAGRKIKHQEARIAQLERTSTTDELTNVLNRRGFEREFHRALRRAQRHGEEGILIYLDLDAFKQVNDSHGHAAGDEVLRQVGRILNESVRQADSVARIGGDEFCVLLVDTSRYDGIKRAEELNHKLNDAFVHWNGCMIAVRATIGIQAYGQGDEAEKVLGCADAAMYLIKQIKESTAMDRVQPVTP